MLPPVVISAERVVKLNQIFRELVSNIIRHANASVVNFNFTVADSTWLFEFADDGIGLSKTSAPGNGLNNISQRVMEINGKLEWREMGPSGTAVTIELQQ